MVYSPNLATCMTFKWHLIDRNFRWFPEVCMFPSGFRNNFHRLQPGAQKLHIAVKNSERGKEEAYASPSGFAGTNMDYNKT